MITDGLSPLAVLVFMGAVLTTVVLIITYVVARLAKRDGVARIAVRTLLAGLGVYAVILLTASLTSRNRVLALGDEKHICEIDCHLAYSVLGAKSESLPDGSVREVVTVKVRFDETTIAPWRPKDAPLSPNSRYVALIDGQNRRFTGSTEALKRRLIPGASYTTDIAFDVPADARDLRLVLRNDDPETRLIIGHENSLLHGKTTFALTRAS
ncbi:MAG TPA: hypothetical protein VKQ05_14315 [Gemmatimonadales bacterium]|nr:hypothetical protein [Gemmatimonadales bacterium]